MSNDIHLIVGDKRRVALPKLPALRPWSEVVIPDGTNELERLTYVSGLVGDIVEWIVRGAHRPNRMMALGSALTTVGTLIGHRVYRSKWECYTYIYPRPCAFGMGKDRPLQAGPKLLDAIGRSDLMPWGEGGWDAYSGFSREMDALTEPGKDKHRSELSRRQTENAVRIATDVAVGRGSRVVEVEDIEWAIVLARHSLETAVGGFEKYMDKYEAFPQKCDSAVAWLKSQPDGFASDSEWYRKLGRSARYGGDPQAITNQLLREHRIVRVQNFRRGTTGPLMHGYRAVDEL